MVFIVFEGLDGSGKSSLLKLLEAELKNRQIDYVRTREPGGTPLGEEIRHLILRTSGTPPSAKTEALLYQASRSQHVDEVIFPALKRGAWVLCDRYTASSVAFQGSARGLGVAAIQELNTFATGGLNPNVTVLLDLPVEEAEFRRLKRANLTGEGPDRIENEEKSFHEKVRQSFLIQSQSSSAPWIVLDARDPIEQLWTTLRDKFVQLGFLN